MTIRTTASTGVHSLCSRASSDPAAFQSKTRDQTESSEFSVKRPFQNETQLTPTNQDQESCLLHAPDRSLLFSDRAAKPQKETPRQVATRGVATVSRAYAQTRRES
jgi:hypothetical protein